LCCGLQFIFQRLLEVDASMRVRLRQCLLAVCILAAVATRDSRAEVVGSPAQLGNPPIEMPPLSAPSDGVPRVAGWPFSFFGNGSRPLYDSLPNDVKPHPSVVRVVAPEDGAIAYGSGTLVGVRDDHGLVVTNWHVVRDATGLVEVVFPDGFRSHARPLKVDQDWDLAALVIWRPNVEPVKIAAQPPRPGDILTIHGYGRGKYRIATGRCTTYYSPQPNFPHEMLELDVEARQGDSGGPIFNQSGELAGVLFGAGQGCTMGSFAPRVRNFLAAVAPDLDQSNAQAKVAVADRPAPVVNMPFASQANVATNDYPSAPWSPPGAVAGNNTGKPPEKNGAQFASTSLPKDAAQAQSVSWGDVNRTGWYEPLKTALAVVGAAAIALRVVKLVR
jgi:S1-C subfamily serine protease